jgi:predicted N-acyltransferase
MVVLRFFKNKKLIGLKPYANSEKAEEIGHKWIKEAYKRNGFAFYEFQILVPFYRVYGKKLLDGTKTFSEYESLLEILKEESIPEIRVLFRNKALDIPMYSGGYEDLEL